jgi:hypothetical protein
MRRFSILISFVLLFQAGLFSQTGDVKIGRDASRLTQTQGAFFDYSDPNSLNIKVSVWGFVKYPGQYLVPAYSSALDVFSYAGGPTESAHLDDLRIYRATEDTANQLFKFNYNDLLWEKNLNKVIAPPNLVPGDILVVPGEPRFYFKDYLQVTVSIVSTLISLTILILNITRN